jgi:hypothetical protein
MSFKWIFIVVGNCIQFTLFKDVHHFVKISLCYGKYYVNVAFHVVSFYFCG